MTKILASGALLLMLSACAKEGQWILKNGKDPMTDAPFSDASIPSTDGHARLSISCSGKDDAAGIILLVDRRVGGYRDEDNYVEQKVDFRFDQGKVSETVGILGDDMIGFRQGTRGKRFDQELLAAFPSADKLSIETVDWRGDQLQMTFDVSGAETVIKQVGEHCKTA